MSTMPKTKGSSPPAPEHSALPALSPEDQQAIEKMSFEAAMAAVEKESALLESGQLSLAESLVAYQRGTALLAHAQSLLDQVVEQIEVIDAQGRSEVSRSELESSR
ncbi:MAG: exodeoxyribonuclease VII small subunit [Betaproteobacteria bacterium]|nr:exodeoxyribonuclease VII small subunit [Betaproteobacteria bacterium]